jgi:hypothetical protein
VFDSAGNLLFPAIQPYGGSFLGGVRVAVGDVTGDEVPDIITAPGKGRRVVVKVFDGTTGAEVPGLKVQAYGANFTSGAFVAVGDVDLNSPGNEIVVAPSKGAKKVKVFGAGVLLNSFFAYSPGYTGGISLAIGNVIGSATVEDPAEIITIARTGTQEVRMFNGDGSQALPSFVPPTISEKNFLAAADTNNDGLVEIVIGTGKNSLNDSTVSLFQTNGGFLSSFLAYGAFGGGVRVGGVDFDNDGFADVATGPGRGTAPELKIFDGLTTDQLDSFLVLEAGDENGFFIGS